MHSDESEAYDRDTFPSSGIFNTKFVITPDNEIGKKIAEGNYLKAGKGDLRRTGLHTVITGRNEYV